MMACLGCLDRIDVRLDEGVLEVPTPGPIEEDSDDAVLGSHGCLMHDVHLHFVVSIFDGVLTRRMEVHLDREEVHIGLDLGVFAKEPRERLGVVSRKIVGKVHLPRWIRKVVVIGEVYVLDEVGDRVRYIFLEVVSSKVNGALLLAPALLPSRGPVGSVGEVVPHIQRVEELSGAAAADYCSSSSS